ncbi:MAG: retroviral-like aspartic protease family protein [Pseudomonadota bacterium]|nr:retroviral-like aspartic protease family protein [Pseudomonadota bacterium]
MATDEQVLAFENADDRMTVPVTIDGGGIYHFIVDTGSQRTVISHELAGALHLASGPQVHLTSMTGNHDVGTVVIPTLSVGPLGGERIEAPALFAQHLGAPGLLGIDTLQGHSVTIDFAKQQMTVTPSIKKRSRAAPHDSGEIVVHARDVLGQLVVTDAEYRGSRIEVIVDTGSMVTMGNMALRELVGRSTGGLQPIELLGVTGELMHVEYAQVHGVKIGDVEINNLPVAFADAAPFRHFNLIKRPALMLGMDALKSFKRVKIDFANREIRLKLNDAINPCLGFCISTGRD